MFESLVSTIIGEEEVIKSNFYLQQLYLNVLDEQY